MQRTFSFSGFSGGDSNQDLEPLSPTQRRADLAKTLSNLTLSPPLANPVTPQPRSNTGRKLAYSSAISVTTSELAIDDDDEDEAVTSLVSDMGGLNMSLSGAEEMGDRLEELVLGMRNKLVSVRPIGDRYADHLREDEVDGAYGYYAEVGTVAERLCRALLESSQSKGHRRSTSCVDVCLERTRRWRAAEGGESSNHRTSEGEDTKAVDAKHLNLVREWRACLDELAAALKMFLTSTYKRHEQFATPEILDALFADRKSRSQVVSGWMKNFGAYKRMQGRSGVWSQWETRLQHYDQVIHSLSSLTTLLQSICHGTTPDRVIQETIIAPQGDTILEFANSSTPYKPILRFQVSSHMLSATSPIFQRMFAKSHSRSPEEVDIDEGQLPPPPTPFVASDGTRVHLYRMPQLEFDTHSSLTILLHAAHLHNALVPRTITFEQFISLAEVSLRYRCTSPLEIYVEHRWLPQWIHKATEEMPYGWVIIAYAFGLRRLFVRTTKSMILNCKGEAELEGMRWPAGVRERICRVREAKMAQVWEVCGRAVEEYLPQSPGPALAGSKRMDMEGELMRQNGETTLDGSLNSPLTGLSPPPATAGNNNSSVAFNFTSTPRCPKGFHWCDATNLGWLMLAFHQLPITVPLRNHAGTLSSNYALPSLPCPQTPPARSLSELITVLRAIPSPPLHPAHTGHHSSVCDPVPAFRAAINDIYNSVTGLTLYEIDGKRHGWGLSAHKKDEPEVVRWSGDVCSETEVDGNVRIAGDAQMAHDTELCGANVGDACLPRQISAAEKVLSDAKICRRILGSVGSFADLHSLAAVNRCLYGVYKQHELLLMRNAIRANRGSVITLPPVGKDTPTPPPLRQRSTSTVDSYLRKLLENSKSPPKRPKARPIVISQPISYAGSSSSSGTATPTSPSPAVLRSPAPSYSSLPSLLSTRSRSSSINPYFKLTEEEARQILWPEPSPPVMPQLSTVEVTAFGSVSHALGEEEELRKFGGSGIRIRRVEEDKCLVVEGNKQLREDIRRRIGLM